MDTANRTEIQHFLQRLYIDNPEHFIEDVKAILNQEQRVGIQTTTGLGGTKRGRETSSSPIETNEARKFPRLQLEDIQNSQGIEEVDEGEEASEENNLQIIYQGHPLDRGSYPDVVQGRAESALRQIINEEVLPRKQAVELVQFFLDLVGTKQIDLANQHVEDASQHYGIRPAQRHTQIDIGTPSLCRAWLEEIALGVQHEQYRPALPANLLTKMKLLTNARLWKLREDVYKAYDEDSNLQSWVNVEIGKPAKVAKGERNRKWVKQWCRERFCAIRGIELDPTSSRDPMASLIKDGSFVWKMAQGFTSHEEGQSQFVHGALLLCKHRPVKA